MFRKVLSAVLAFSLMASVAGCSGGAANSAAPAASAGDAAKTTGAAASTGGAPTGDPIKIGYVSALSGDTALWGQAGLNGMKLAVEDLNAKGGLLGRPVQVVGYDGQGQPLDSVNALNKLIDEEKVVAVVGTNFSSCNIAMAPVADSKKIPLIATAASSPQVTVDQNGKLHPYSFRIGFTDPFQGKVVASYVIKKLNVKKAAIITDIGDNYSTGVTGYITKEFTDLGGTIVAKEEARSGDNDFRAQLSKIKVANPDVLFIPWVYKDVALITKQAKDLGITCQFVGTDGWDSQDLPKLAGAAIDGGYFCSRPGFNTPEAKAFAERYKTTCKLTPEVECLFGYDGVMWLAQVIKQQNSAESDKIRDGLEKTTEFKGYLGSMTIDPATHNPTRDAAIFRVKNSTVHFVEMYSVK
jgi:branched-chain amino acid transport system substrate-binding protein